MPGYVDGLIDSELPRAKDGIAIAFNQVMSDAISAGAAGGSRMFVSFQSVISEHVRLYAQTLRDRLSQFDAKHAPFTVGEFDKLITSINSLAEWATAEYGRRRENNKTAGGGNGLAIDEQRLAAAVSGAQNELRGLLSQIRSTRSVLGILRDRTLDALGQHAAMAFWTIFVFVLGLIMRGPIDALAGWLVNTAR